MSVLSGQIILADHMNRAQPVVYSDASSANVAMTGSAADITGCSITFTTLTNNAQVDISWVADFEAITTSAALAIVYANIDGVADSPIAAVGETDTSGAMRFTAAQQSTKTLATAGSHTIKLQGQKLAGADSAIQIAFPQTTLRVSVREVIS